jgi:hypothetical protein
MRERFERVLSVVSGSHSPLGNEPVPSAPAPVSEPVGFTATVLEWLSWEGETFGETLSWAPGEAH